MEKVKVADLLEKKRNPVHACVGCDKATGWTATGYVCPVYAEPHKMYTIRVFGICPHNKPKVEEKKKFVRVGQQKTKRNRR
jgi:hypothetical protein